MDNDKNNEVKWYRKKWFMWLMLICCWPIGLVFLYMHRSEYTRKKLLQIAVLTFFVVVCLQAWSKLNQPETQKQSSPVQTKQTEQVTDVPQPNSINAVAYLFKLYVKPDASGCFTYMQVLFADGHTQDVKTDVDIYPFPPGSVGYMVWRSTY